MTTRILTALTACLFFLLGKIIYTLAVHHTLPTLADIPASIETVVVIVTLAHHRALP